MWNVLIVDDEYLAQAQMRHIINWEEHGFTIAGICPNGESAVEFLKDNPIDVIFTDVCMPIMDGIELTKYINENYPHIKVIITSSYSDLNYVKEAFRANAFEYFLKHTVTEDSLICLLKKLDAALSLTADTSSRDSTIPVSDHIDYKQDIIDMITGLKSSNNIHNSVVAVGLIHNFAIVKKTHSSEDLKILFDNIVNTVSYALKNVEGFVIFMKEENRFVIYLPFPKTSTEPEIMNALYNHIRQINYSMKKFFNLSFLWGVSRLSSPAFSLSDCFYNAAEMLEKNPIIDKDRSGKTNPHTTLSVNHEKELLTAISVLDESRINGCLEQIFYSASLNTLGVSILLGELITFANRICVDYSIDINEILKAFPEDNAKIMNSIKTVDEGLAYSKDFFKVLLDIYKKKTYPSRNSKYVKLVMDFISNHYHKDLSLEEIASEVGLSVSHLSSVFKAETGQNINSYLTGFRIEKAKQLLVQNADLKHIYSMVGFNNYNYFFVIFKRHVGCTPNEYKRKYSKQISDI